MSTPELHEAFNHFDADGNGRIDKKEFAQLMLGLDDQITDEEIEIGFSIIDRDGNGTIDFEEFETWWEDR